MALIFNCDFASGVNCSGANAFEEIAGFGGSGSNTIADHSADLGGGSTIYEVSSTAHDVGNTNDRILPFSDKFHATYYWRVYCFFPTGYKVNTNKAVTLKIFDIQSASGDRRAVVKLTTTTSFTDDPLEIAITSGSGTVWIDKVGSMLRNEWNLIEVHVTAQAGNDVVEVWVNADATKDPPTGSKTDGDIFETGNFNQISVGGNWSSWSGVIDQEFYMKGFKCDNANAIGDEFGLLGSSPAPQALLIA